MELGYLTPENTKMIDREVTSSGIEDGMIYTMVKATLDDERQIDVLYIVNPETLDFVAANIEDGDITTNYQFSYEGMHGFPHATRTGFVRNASVEVDCKAVNGMKYTSSCGEFYVGETHSCTQDIVISEGSPNHGVETFTIESPLADGMNLRNAIVNFNIEKGQKIGIIGESGCGKSTLLKIVSGLYVPTSGIIEVCGKTDPKEISKCVSVVMQTPMLLPLSIYENITLGHDYPADRIGQVCKMANIKNESENNFFEHNSPKHDLFYR